MTHTPAQLKTPPLQIGMGVTLNHRADRDGFVCLMYLSHNRYTPFSVVKWYPWNGEAEWASGDYYTTAKDAVTAYMVR